MNPEQNGLERFHPRIAGWFEERCGRPTPMQQDAWSLIAAGNHVLVTAPTGSGKTLAAFLWPLDRLIRGRWALGQTRVLYVSPLKALNNDIQTVIMDEIHAVIGNKRGTLLMSAIDRLVPLCGEFQRIALSATVNPEATVAEFIWTNQR